MKVVYVAGPFTGKNTWEVEQNVRRAEEAGYEVACLGAAPLIPHANTHVFNGTLTDEFWYAATAALMRKCDAVYLMKNWRESRGATAERAEALRLGILVFDDLTNLKEWLGGGKKE